MALTDSLISFWKLEEASGNRADEVGGNTLADVNTVTQAAGIVGNASLHALAGVEYLSIGDNAALSTGDIDFTISYWIYFISLTATQQIITKWNSTGNDREYACNYDGDPNNRFQLVVDSAGDGVTSSTIVANSFGAPPSGQWIHVVCWHDSVANTINIRINNGATDSGAHSAGLSDQAADFRIGALGDASGPIDARMDAVGFWKKVLSEAEHNQLQNGGFGVEHPFNEILEGQVHVASMGVYV